MKPSKKLVGKNSSSSSIIEGTNHLRKTLTTFYDKIMDVVVIGALPNQLVKN
jgi:hypothetical protein